MSENLLCLMRFGSHLYGTDTEKSDTDYKGIYLPPIDEVILQDVKKSINNITKADKSAKNTNEDVDREIYSLHYFLKLALKGETVAIDMLHAPMGWEDNISEEWFFIKRNRSKFYKKNLRSYIGYVRIQAAKYGIKGSRLNAAEEFINFLKSKKCQTDKLALFWDEIQESEFVKKRIIEEASQEDKRGLVIIEKCFMATTPIRYVIQSLDVFVKEFGERAKLAKENKGVDFKAVSHAFRAAFQLEEIYTTGNLIFPLKEADFIRSVKQGKYHYADELAAKLEYMVDRVYQLASESTYPEEVDKGFWGDWLISLYR